MLTNSYNNNHKEHNKHNFEDGPPMPGELFRSSTWPRGSCLEEAVSWEAATQVM